MSKSEPKQVIVVRKDLNMRKGKIAAQSSHASLGAILNYADDRTINSDYLIIPLYDKNAETLYHQRNNPHPLREWLNGRFTKICVSVDNEQELLDIYQKALDNGVNVKLIKDAGLTEFGGVPTYTCLALGPDYPEKLDPISGHLKLL